MRDIKSDALTRRCVLFQAACWQIKAAQPAAGCTHTLSLYVCVHAALTASGHGSLSSAIDQPRHCLIHRPAVASRCHRWLIDVRLERPDSGITGPTHRRRLAVDFYPPQPTLFSLLRTGDNVSGVTVSGVDT